MTLKFMGKKEGMTRTFDKDGNLVVCTVISVAPNVVSQIKSTKTDGYNALQLAAIKVPVSKLRKVPRPQQGLFKKAGIDPHQHMVESRLEDVAMYQVGQEIPVSYFSDCKFVDVTGRSKGKGHQGVIKRHGFAGGPASHGSGFHRHGGSCGMRSSPGRCLPGQKKSGHMGAEQVTVQGLEVVRIDEANKLMVVKGAVPGARGGLVYITRATRRARGRG